MSCTFNVPDYQNYDDNKEHLAIDFMQDRKINVDVLGIIQDVYPQSAIVYNNEISSSKMLLMIDEIFRIKTAVGPLRTAATAALVPVNQKLDELCARYQEHINNRNDWIAYRDSLDPGSPTYVADFNAADDMVDLNQTKADVKYAEAEALHDASVNIRDDVDSQFKALVQGMVKAKYKINTTVGSLIDLPAGESLIKKNEFYVNEIPETNTAYCTTVINKMNKLTEFSRDSESTTKLKTKSWEAAVSDGTGLFSSVLSVLTARNVTYNDSGQPVSDIAGEYRPALIEAYGSEMITAALYSKNIIELELAFLETLLVSTNVNTKVVFDTATYAWLTYSHTYQVPSWYADQNTDLYVLQQGYNATDDTLSPYP